MGIIRVRVAVDMIRKNKNKHIWDKYIWPRCTRQHAQPFAGINHQYQDQEGRRRGEGGQYQDHVNIMTLVSPRNPGNGKRYPPPPRPLPSPQLSPPAAAAAASRTESTIAAGRSRGYYYDSSLSSLGWRSRQLTLPFGFLNGIDTMATGSGRLVEYYGVLCMWRLVWFWCRKMSHTKKQRRSARQRGRREREEYLRAGPSILSRFLSIFNILMLWASQGTVGRDRGGRQTDRRVLFFVLFHQ